MSEHSPGAGSMLRAAAQVARDAVDGGVSLAWRESAAACVSLKDGGRDVVTSADVAVEDSIRSTLERAFGWPVVGEERGGSAPVDGEPYWLLDPICGTRNFASRIPLWCVNLALIEGGEVVVAVVGDASTGETVVAQRGEGSWAFRDGATRRLSATDETAMIVVEAGKAKGERRERAGRFAAAAVGSDRWDVCALGSTVAFPYVATGRMSAYAIFFAPAVHLAAGVLLAQEAGATVSDIDGRPWTVASDSALAAATSGLHAELFELL